MKIEEISYKDLSNKQLENLKEIYIESRLNTMTNEELKSFVKTIIADQIQGTVGNQEEREAWKEMKDHFKEEFEDKIKFVITAKAGNAVEEISPEEKELTKRIDLIEKRKKEKAHENEDMW